MEIKEVKLNTIKSDNPKNKNTVQIVMVTADGNEHFVPNDKSNRHYIEVKAWYDSQKKKPFKYDF